MKLSHLSSVTRGFMRPNVRSETGAAANGFACEAQNIDLGLTRQAEVAQHCGEQGHRRFNAPQVLKIINAHSAHFPQPPDSRGAEV